MKKHQAEELIKEIRLLREEIMELKNKIPPYYYYYWYPNSSVSVPSQWSYTTNNNTEEIKQEVSSAHFTIGQFSMVN